MTSNLLADRLIPKFRQLRGAKEHLQIANLIEKARKFRLTDKTVYDLTHAVTHHTVSVERNIDLIPAPAEPMWIEYSDHPRRLYGASAERGSAHPENVGCLIEMHPDNEDQMVIVTAWDFEDGSVRHSYAVAALNLVDMAHLAWGARNRFTSDSISSVQRLILQPTTWVPNGLLNEIDNIEAIDNPHRTIEASEERIRGARLDVVSEVPFLLASLLAIALPGTIKDTGEGYQDVSLPTVAPSTFLWRRRGGFIRSGSKKNPKLGWVTPRGSLTMPDTLPEPSSSETKAA